MYRGESRCTTDLLTDNYKSMPAWSSSSLPFPLLPSCYKLEIEHTNIDLGASTQPIITKNRRPFNESFLLLVLLLISRFSLLSNNLISSDYWFRSMHRSYSSSLVSGTPTIVKELIDLWRNTFHQRPSFFYVDGEKKKCKNTIIRLVIPPV